MAVEDVYFLTLHEPYQDSGHPVPINATLVHVRSLLHPGVPQPDGAKVYRCLTEFPGRTPGCVVPLSTLTFELNGGKWWHKVGDWEAVSEAVAHLARVRACDAMPISLPQVTASLLALGPNADLTLHHPDGTRSRVGAREREHHLHELTELARARAAEAPFWPGTDLVEPPRRPRWMPYKPFHP